MGHINGQKKCDFNCIPDLQTVIVNFFWREICLLFYDHVFSSLDIYFYCAKLLCYKHVLWKGISSLFDSNNMKKRLQLYFCT